MKTIILVPMVALLLSGCEYKEQERPVAEAPTPKVPSAVESEENLSKAELPVQRGTSQQTTVATQEPTDTVPPSSDEASETANVLRNSEFSQGATGWTFWASSVQLTDTVVYLDGAVRVLNPYGKLVGVQQSTAVKSGTIYRLSGWARSMITNDPGIGFGARLAFYVPGKKEEQIVWMSEYNNWLEKTLVFTNTADTTATVYAHLGYGDIISTGEFTKIRLDIVK